MKKSKNKYISDDLKDSVKITESDKKALKPSKKDRESIKIKRTDKPITNKK